MGIILAFIAATVFLLGLYSWARGGAGLWTVFKMRREEKGMTKDEKASAEREIKRIEQAATRTISASFRIITGLAVFVWLLLGITVVCDMLGINWMRAMYSRAKSYWVAPGIESQQSSQTRNETLRNMGNSFRR